MKPVKNTKPKSVPKKVPDSAKLLNNARKKIDHLKIKKQIELERINLRKQQDLEKFQAKKESVYQKKIDKLNNKMDLSSKQLSDLEALLK